MSILTSATIKTSGVKFVHGWFERTNKQSCSSNLELMGLKRYEYIA